MFDTTELLEAILCQALPTDVLVASHFCSKWASLIHISPQIATKLLEDSIIKDTNVFPTRGRTFYFSVTTTGANKRLIIYRDPILNKANFILADSSKKKLLFLAAHDIIMDVQTYEQVTNLIFTSRTTGERICETMAKEWHAEANSWHTWLADRYLQIYAEAYLLRT